VESQGRVARRAGQLLVSEGESGHNSRLAAFNASPAAGAESNRAMVGTIDTEVSHEPYLPGDRQERDER
jgi:hypothetical protein